MKKYIVLGLLLIGLLVYLYHILFSKHPSSTEFPSGSVEKIVVDPVKHTLVVSRPSRPNEDLFLPKRPTTISIDDEGNLKVAAKQYGTEMSPFLGFGLATNPRAYAGIYGLYYKNVDAGLFVSTTLTSFKEANLGIAVSYTFYNNTAVFIGLDNKKVFNAGLTIKL